MVNPAAVYGSLRIHALRAAPAAFSGSRPMGCELLFLLLLFDVFVYFSSARSIYSYLYIYI